jgi:hypothetical protein
MRCRWASEGCDARWLSGCAEAPEILACLREYHARARVPFTAGRSCAGSCAVGADKLASSSFQRVQGPKSFNLSWTPPQCNNNTAPATTLSG